ncbi:MAG: hypothetical protein WA093_00155 [Minisyncoccales bacterium]
MKLSVKKDTLDNPKKVHAEEPQKAAEQFIELPGKRRETIATWYSPSKESGKKSKK